MKKERLIKKMIIALGLSTAIICGSVAAGTAIEARRINYRYQKNIDRLNEEVSSIVEEKINLLDEYESSDYYQKEYNYKKNVLVADLIDNQITGREYESMLNYLDSNNFSQEVLESSIDEENKAKLAELDKDIDKLHDKIDHVKGKKQEYIGKKGIVVGLSGTMAAMLPYTMFMTYCIKGYKKERDKEDLTI